MSSCPVYVGKVFVLGYCIFVHFMDCLFGNLV